MSSWQCSTCTFVNLASAAACAMCGSKWICSVCTLANLGTAVVCSACGTPPPSGGGSVKTSSVTATTKQQQADAARMRKMMVSGIQFQMGMPRLMDGSDEDSEASIESGDEIKLPKGKPATAGGKDAADPKFARVKDGSDEDSEVSTSDTDDEPPKAAPPAKTAPPPATGPPKPADTSKPPEPKADGKEPPKPPAPAGTTEEKPKKKKKAKKPKKLDADGNPIKETKKSKLMKAKKRRQAKARAKAAEERLVAEELALIQLLAEAATAAQAEAKKNAEAGKPTAPPPPAAAGGASAAAPPPPAAAADAKTEAPAPRMMPVLPLTFVFFGNSGCGKSYLINELKENQKQYFRGLSASAAARSRTNFIECIGLLDTEGRTGEYLEQITVACQTPRTIPVLVMDAKFRFTESFDACLAALSLCLNLVANDYILVINQIQSSRKVGQGEQAKQLKEFFQHIAQNIGRAPSKTCLVRFDGDFTQDNIAGRYLPLQGVLGFENFAQGTSEMEGRLNFVAAQLQITENVQNNRSENMDKFWPSTKADEKWSGIPETIRTAWTDKDPDFKLYDKPPFVVPSPANIEKLAAGLGDFSSQAAALGLGSLKGKEKNARVPLARLAFVHQTLLVGAVPPMSP